MRVIVCGSRRWHDREKIAHRLFDLPVTSMVIHGGATGADRIAGQEAEKLGLRVAVYPADWHDHDRTGESGVRCHCQPGQETCPAAGLRRNERMACNADADLLIAFWDGNSRGTQDMIDRARAHGITVEVVQ